MSWEQDLEEIQQRLTAFDKAREVAAAQEAAVSHRFAGLFEGFYLPLPPVARDSLSLYGEWRAEEGIGTRRIDLDTQGRPVASGYYLWFWEDDGSFVEIQLVGHGPYIRRVRHEHVVTVTPWDHTVQLLTWRDGEAVRADGATRAEHGGKAWIRTADYVDGRLARVRSAGGPGGADIHEDLALAAKLVPGTLVWDGRIDTPELWPEDPNAFVEPLAASLDRATRAALAASSLPETFLIELVPRRDFALPPTVRAIATSWRDGMRRSSADHGAAIEATYRAADAGAATVLHLVDHLDDAALQACRALTTAFVAGDAAAADPIAEAVGDRLSELLNGTPIPGTADPFLALVHVGARYRRKPPQNRIDPLQLARFMASVTSTRRRPRRPGRALHDRDALEAYLRDGGLDAQAHRIAHELAEVGNRLVKGDGPSHLGGPPKLPPDTEWPAGHTFLAAIQTDDGWMLFFANLDELTDEATNTPGSLARVFVTDTPVPAEGPALEPRRVTLEPVLTLPDAWSAQLDPFDTTMYDELTERLRPRRGHWVGGHAQDVQGAPPQAGTVLLLHLADDHPLGFGFMDAGSLQFRIPRGSRDWSRIRAFASSC